MNALTPVLRLHEHRIWVNHQLLAACQGLTAEQLGRQFQIGQGSAWRTLTHLYAGEYVWLAALEGDEQPLMPGDAPGLLPGNQQGEGAMQSLSELAANWSALDVRWRAYLASLTEDALDDIVYKVSTSSGLGRRLGTRRLDVLLHVCTHAHYTTAQLINMLRQLGVQPLPDPMLMTLARQEA